MSPARDERPTGPRAAPRDPAVSVVVPVFNGAHLIDGCLAALDGQTLEPERYEVVVVDDGSTDGTPQRVRAFAERARSSVILVAQPENRGPAAARNAGVAAARAPVIAFTDSDCEPASDWLERALGRFGSDPGAAGVEGRTDPKGEPGTLTHQMINTMGGLWMTCNMFYTREALEKAGGFDERFRLAFLEDSDIAFAVQQQGRRIVWDPEVRVYHLVLPAGRKKFRREARKRFYNALLYAKHPELYVRHLKPVVPGLPRLHVRYMGWTAATMVLALLHVFSPVRLGGGAVFTGLLSAFYFRRVAHAYRARDLVSLLQVSVHPFVQTYWVIRGAIRFRAFSLDL